MKRMYKHGDNYVMVEESEVLEILARDERAFYESGMRIPYRSNGDLWRFMESITDKILSALGSGKLKYTENRPEFNRVVFSVISDDLGGGVLCPADGKRYDSKSAYYRAVKSKGLEIVGNDAPKEMQKREHKSIDWKEAVAETLKQTP